MEVDRLLAAFLTAVIALAFCGLRATAWHWFLLPTTLCGLLIGPDAVRWLRGGYDLYDPKGMVGAFGWYFFFLVPLLFVSPGRDVVAFDDPPDWRPWVGYLGLINAACLILYQGAQRAGFSAPGPRPRQQARWTIDARRAWPYLLFFGGVALLGQATYVLRSGGIAGIIHRASLAQETGRIEITGLGLFEYAGGSLPMILLIALTLITEPTRKRPSSVVITGLLLVTFSVAQFLVGGFTGSRSATVWSIIWIAGIVHSFWRKISRRMAGFGVAILFGFMYIYGFYKSGGVEALRQVAAGESLHELEAATGRTLEGLLLGDLARVDVQAYELYRLDSTDEYSLRWGKTYASALLRNLPSRVWPGRPADAEKTIAGTELFYGSGRYVPGDRWRNTSRVFGLAGEAMLNFGIWLAPLPFVLWGFLMGRYRRATISWPRADARRFLAPLIALLITIALFSDLDNLISLLIDKAALIALLIFLSSKRTRNESPDEQN
jgi:hypothetical protein